MNEELRTRAAIHPRIWIISTKLDAATDVVIEKLRDLSAETHRLDTEDFPYDSSLTLRFSPVSPDPDLVWRQRNDESDILIRPTALWYRRIRIPQLPEGQNPGIHDFCTRNARSALLSAALLCEARVMSSPTAIWSAENKPVQLKAANLAGLIVPQTVITNDPQVVKASFHEFGGQMIIKPLRTGYVDDGTQQWAIYTSQVLREHLEHLGNDLDPAPAIYQKLIPKACDVRVTIVGRKLFAAEIDSQIDESASIDWRRTTNPELPHRRTQLPEKLQSALFHLMDLLGISFGAIDLVRLTTGDYVFLEVNPSGQWLWLDDKLDLGISDAVAKWLCEVG